MRAQNLGGGAADSVVEDGKRPCSHRLPGQTPCATHRLRLTPDKIFIERLWRTLK